MPKYREFDDERHFYSSIKRAQEIGFDYEELFYPYEIVIN
jgi:hypothetical protein